MSFGSSSESPVFHVGDGVLYDATGLKLPSLGVSLVNSVTGTANQITASPTTGAVVLSLPASILIPAALTIQNAGTLTIASGGTETIASGGAMTVASGATVTVASGGTLSVAFGATQNVTGTLNIGVAGVQHILMGGAFVVDSGATSTIAAGGSHVIAAGATETVSGTLNIATGSTSHVQSGGQLLVDSGGILSVTAGGTGYVLGTLNVGNGATAGTFSLQNGSTSTALTGATITWQSGINWARTVESLACASIAVPVVATTRLFKIAFGVAAYDFSSTNPAKLTINNAAITASTTCARGYLTAVDPAATQSFYHAITGISTGTMQLWFFGNTVGLTTNSAFTFVIEIID